MAVFTTVSTEQIAVFLQRYTTDPLVSATAIAEGTDNSNYIIETQSNKYILTLFEQRFDADTVLFYMEYMNHLAQKNIPCPTPLVTTSGEYVGTLQERPTTFVSFVQGKSVKNPTTEHLKALGKHMAKLHIAGSDFPKKRDNDFNVNACWKLFHSLSDKAETIKTNLAKEIEQELVWLEKNWPDDLPSGMIHADLFPDNVFFEGTELSAVIDFYYACYDAYLYDLAVCLNAWCFERGNDLNLTKSQALLNAYQSIRPLEEKERQALPFFASASAMRFLLMRLKNWKSESHGSAIVTHRDPVEYLHRIRFHHGLSQYELYGI